MSVHAPTHTHTNTHIGLRALTGLLAKGQSHESDKSFFGETKTYHSQINWKDKCSYFSFLFVFPSVSEYFRVSVSEDEENLLKSTLPSGLDSLGIFKAKEVQWGDYIWGLTEEAQTSAVLNRCYYWLVTESFLNSSGLRLELLMCFFSRWI